MLIQKWEEAQDQAGIAEEGNEVEWYNSRVKVNMHEMRKQALKRDIICF